MLIIVEDCEVFDFKSVINLKSFRFAIRIVNLYRYLCSQKKEFVLSKQLLRAGTSIGANVSESQRAVSKRDFGSKLAIALKEANETEYWINLLYATGYLSESQFRSINADCIELVRILTAILKKTTEQSAL